MASRMTNPRTTPVSYHDVHLKEHPSRALVWRVVADYVSPWIAPTDRVVEIGAGYCQWINAVEAARRVAVDSWPDFPRFAASGVETVVLDAAVHLSTLGSGTFDVALASNVLEHFDADSAASVVADVAALLKPHGRFIIVQPNFAYAYRHYFDDYTHRSVFTHVSLCNLLRAHGFDIEVSLPKFLPYSMRDTRWPIHAWMVRAYLASPFKPFAGQMLVVGRKS
jgi:SAM-dependent methyltransferase